MVSEIFLSWPVSLKNCKLAGKNIATPDCFPTYLVNADSMESRSLYTETGFMYEQLCIETFVVVADAEE